jgi:hypothetical protein
MEQSKAINKGVRMYSNYATELGLIAKIGDGDHATRSRLKFVLLIKCRNG